MTNEEFQKKLTQKSIDELANERVNSVFSHKEGVHILFRRYYDYFNSDDLEMFKRVLLGKLSNNQSSCKGEQLTPEQELLRLYCVFASAKDAMRDLVIAMCHDMRGEDDYAGLAELHDAVLKLPYYLYQPLSYIIFNDLFDTGDVFEHEGNELYQTIVKKFNSYYCDLRTQADDEWACCQLEMSNSIRDDSSPRELTREYLHELWELHSNKEDILLLSTIEKREIMALGFVMLIEHVLRALVLERAFKMRTENDYDGIANMLQSLDQTEDISSELRKKCAGLLMSRPDY